jgi:hypothetical protein
VADAPIVELAAELGCRSVEKGALLGGERDRRDAAELVPIRRARENFGIPADRARFQRLALGFRDRRHRAFQRAIGGKHEVVALDLGEARHDEKRNNEPTEQRPQREDRPVKCAVRETHLRAQGENCRGQRPSAQRSAVHGQREDGQDGNERENDFSHERPLNVPWPPVPD